MWCSQTFKKSSFALHIHNNTNYTALFWQNLLIYIEKADRMHLLLELSAQGNLCCAWAVGPRHLQKRFSSVQSITACALLAFCCKFNFWFIYLIFHTYFAGSTFFCGYNPFGWQLMVVVVSSWNTPFKFSNGLICCLLNIAEIKLVWLIRKKKITNTLRRPLFRIFSIVNDWMLAFRITTVWPQP